MGAVIKNYSLYIADRDEISVLKNPNKKYKPAWDGWVLNKEDLKILTEAIKFYWEEGCRPIVTIFIEKK